MEGVAREDGSRWDGANIGGGGMVLTEEGEGGEVWWCERRRGRAHVGL